MVGIRTNNTECLGMKAYNQACTNMPYFFTFLTLHCCCNMPDCRRDVCVRNRHSKLRFLCTLGLCSRRRESDRHTHAQMGSNCVWVVFSYLSEPCCVQPHTKRKKQQGKASTKHDHHILTLHHAYPTHAFTRTHTATQPRTHK
jgi:hypothetical protein